LHLLMYTPLVPQRVHRLYSFDISEFISHGLTSSEYEHYKPLFRGGGGGGGG
jgi:hypothetical protein